MFQISYYNHYRFQTEDERNRDITEAIEKMMDLCLIGMYQDECREAIRIYKESSQKNKRCCVEE